MTVVDNFNDDNDNLLQNEKYSFIRKTCLYNFDPLKSHLYIVKLGFTGVCIIFSYLCSKTYNVD